MTLIDTLFTWISAANEALWGWCVLWLLVGVSIGLTFLLKGFQFRKWRAMFGVFGRESEAVRRNGQGISSFQAFCVSLGARVGTGNLAGVASAIAVGGPGAVFWMWVMALFGAATAFAEAVLAQLYKRRGEGSFFGGPAYYMKYGLKCAPMGVAFATVLVLNQGMASHIVQSNAICGILGEAGLGMEAGKLEYAVAGIGVNTARMQFPPELQEIATSIGNECGESPDRNRLIAEILNETEALLGDLETGHFLEESRRRSNVIGRTVTVIEGEKRYPAKAVDIDDQGRLVIETAEGQTRLNYGEVSLKLNEKRDEDQ